MPRFDSHRQRSVLLSHYTGLTICPIRREPNSTRVRLSDIPTSELDAVRSTSLQTSPRTTTGRPGPSPHYLGSTYGCPLHVSACPPRGGAFPDQAPGGRPGK